MNGIKENLNLVVEWLYAHNFIWFLFGFTIFTFLLTALTISPFYYLTDIYFKVYLLPEKDDGQILLSLFLIIWLICMTIVASLLFRSGSRFLKYLITSNRVDDLKTSGLVNKTEHSISLIGLSLIPFSDEDWRNIFENKLKDGVKIRLLIADPDTDFTLNRVTSVGGSEDKLSDDIKESIKKFKGFKGRISEQHRNNFEVRSYKNNASMSTFIFDDEIRLGLMIEKGTGLTAPEIRISNRGKQVALFKQVKGHFDNVWDAATEV